MTRFKSSGIPEKTTTGERVNEEDVPTEQHPTEEDPRVLAKNEQPQWPKHLEAT